MTNDLTPNEERLREEARPILRNAREVAFGENGVVMAAQTGVAGSVKAESGLSERDNALIAAGCLAGAAGAIAYPQNPREARDGIVPLIDSVMDLAREEGMKGRRGLPIFDLLPVSTEGEVA